MIKQQINNSNLLGFVWTNWLLYRIERAGYLKIYINYIIYFKYIKYMSESGRVWCVWNFMTWTQPDMP